MVSYAHCIKEDAARRGLLYLGTENGMYVSFDDGETWQPLQMNLPHTPVYGLAVQERFHDLVIATYGRGFWILDDLTPLQHLTPQVLAESAHLFPPLPAYRFRQITNDSVIREDEVSAGNDPPYGAGVNYYLKTAPAGTVAITILDSKGQVVRVLPGTNIVGINRIHWNLRYETSTPIQMRTTRRSSDGGQFAILAPPGTYSVKLSVDGREFTQPLTVIKDPHSGGTEADIQAQMTTLFELRRDMDRAAGVVNAIEMARSQIEALVRVVDDQTITKAAEALNQKLIAVEENLVELRVRASGGSKLARKLSYLANELASSDFKPTNQQLEVQKLLEERFATLRGLFDSLRTRDLSALNELLRQRKVPHIITTEAQ
jgi:hypothetical protein